MKKSLLLTTLLLSSVPIVSFSAEIISYCEGTILENEDDVITLMGGSKWKTNGNFFSYFGDVLIIQSSTELDGRLYNFNEMYSNGNRDIVTKILGECPKSSGRKATVMEELNDGKTLLLDDGTALGFDSYDSFDTGFWLPPYDVLITGDELYMWNLNNGKRVWIQSVD